MTDQSVSPIPLCDLKAQYVQIESKVTEAMKQVVESCAFIKGPAVKTFEANYGAMHGLAAENAIGCSNGTSALTVAIKALKLKAGSEIILPSHTFFATAESILLAGCVPVFTDVKADDYTLDPAHVEALISENTSAICPVHIYGGMADMDALGALAEKHDLKLLEDTAQAHLATWNGKMAGTIGDAGTYSFYPGKNLGAYGDAGMVVTKHVELADHIRKLVDHGRKDKYLHDIVGDNLRIDSIQAAVLDVKLKYLPEWSENRRRVAKRYDAQLQEAGFKVIEPPAASKPVYHLYIVEVGNREEVMTHLKSKSIASGIHYPVPVHRQPALIDAGYTVGPMDVTNRIVERIVSLPIFPEMTDSQIDRVLEAFLEVAKR